MMLSPVTSVLMQLSAVKGAAPKSVLDMVMDLSPLSMGVLVLLGCLSALLRTATTISSKSGELRLMISRCPLVSGSNEPGNMARRIIT